jgi:hypothetical protein
MATFADADLAVQVMNAAAKRVGVSGAPLAAVREVTLQWKISDNNPAQMVGFLDRFGVGDNYDAETPVESHVVTNAVVENEAMPGNWRVIRNFVSPEAKNYVFSTRRKGWITSLVTDGAGEADDVVDWSEGRILTHRDHRSMSDGEEEPTFQTDDFLVVQWRGVDPENVAAIAATLMGATFQEGWVPFGDSNTYGDGWSPLPVVSQEGEDGSYLVTLPLVRFGITVVSHHGIGTSIAQSVTVETLPEDQLQARIGVLVAAGHTDVAGSRSPETGIAQIRYTTLTSTAGSITWSYTIEDGQVEYHKLAWEQPLADAAAITAALNYTPGSPALTHVIRRAGSVSRNPQTLRWGYHIVVRDGGTQISDDSENPDTSHRLHLEVRRMWDTANLMHIDQWKLICYAHQVCTFPSFSAANAWQGGASAAAPDRYVDGMPVWDLGTPLPPEEGLSSPRLIGVNKWVASKRVIAWASGWYDPTS